MNSIYVMGEMMLAASDTVQSVQTARTIRHRTRRASASWSAIGLVAAMHVALIAALLQVESVRTATLATLPMLVSFIAAEAKPDVPPEQRKVQTRPLSRPKLPQPPPVVAAPAATPAATPAALPAEAPLAEPAPPQLPRETAPEAPAVIPPRFDAAYLDNPPPVYPLISRRSGEQGRVLLRVFVSADGLAGSVTVHSTSGSRRLDLAAQEAVRRWRFTPAQQGGNAVAAWVIVPIVFQLEE